MNEDKLYKNHDRKISFWTGGYSVFIILAIFLNWDNNQVVFTFIEKIYPLSIEIQNFISYAAVIGISYAIGSILTTIRFHNFVDHTFFKTRKTIDKHIVSTLNSFLDKMSNRTQLRDPTHDEVMDIFYVFIDKPDFQITRGQSFSYWARYFICCNLIVLSIIGYAIFFAMNVIGNNIEQIISLLIYLIFVTIGLSSFNALLIIKPKLQTKIADPQLTKITKDLKKQLETTFTIRLSK